MEAMNILNEVASRFPDAISFAAGRPPDQFLPVALAGEWLQTFAEHAAAASGRTVAAQTAALGQYSETNGIIRDLMSRHLKADEDLDVEPASCMVTNGAQEAIFLSLMALVGRDRCIVSADPTYVGLTGAAAAFGAELLTLPDDGHLVSNLEALIKRGDRQQIGAFYCIPDFSNPLGRVMSLEDRSRLLALARENDFHIIEDAAYRHYRYEGETLPSIKSLDTTGHVLFISSFAKTFLPGIRTAVLVANHKDASGRLLADRMAWLKSYVSVASSPITQAILGGYLLNHAFSLAAAVAPRRQHCKANRDLMLDNLQSAFAGSETKWTCPQGGFFLSLDVPIEFGEREMIACARDTGVIVVPMSMFSPSGSRTRQVRFAFSNIMPDRIAEGVERFAKYLESVRSLPLEARGRFSH